MKRNTISPTQKYVAYYRVSTTKQEKSGLGLEAQRHTVKQFIKNNGNHIIGEFTDIESGSKNDRTEFNKAIQMALKQEATLVIAKLDRMSRDVEFTAKLMKSKVKFVCCDMPDADEFTIHIYAALAEQERKRISKRIKEALDAKRVREPDWVPGNPQNMTHEARQKGQEAIKHNARYNPANVRALSVIKLGRKQTPPMTYDKIAEELNESGHPTRTGKQWKSYQVWKLYTRYVEHYKLTRTK